MPRHSAAGADASSAPAHRTVPTTWKPTRARRSLLRRVPWGSAAAAVLVIGYVAAFAWAMAHTGYDIWAAMMIFPVLLMISAPILARITAHEQSPVVYRLLMLALTLKLLSALPRWAMVFVLYDSQGDAKMYDERGAELAKLFRQGIFQADLDMKIAGTGFVIILTGIIYTLTGPTILGGFLIFSWLSFWGLLLFWRAFQIGFPDADRIRYGKLLFFLPSLLFWPSSIGKDAWMMFTLGIGAYGTALLLQRRTGGFPLVVISCLGSSMVRPHVTALFVAGLAIAYLLRRRPAQLSALGPVKAIIGIAVLAVGCMIVLQQVSGFFGTESADGGAVNEVLNETQRRTSQGGSVVGEQDAGQAAGGDPTVNPSPLTLPYGLVTVLFRPFPFEAHNVQALAASVESTVLMGVVIVSWPRLRQLPRLFVKQPYIAFVVVYTALFCWAFANISNLGILSRERVQVLPFVLLLLCIPKPRRMPRRSGAAILAAARRGGTGRGTGPGGGAGPATGARPAAHRERSPAADRADGFDAFRRTPAPGRNGRGGPLGEGPPT